MATKRSADSDSEVPATKKQAASSKDYILLTLSGIVRGDEDEPNPAVLNVLFEKDQDQPDLFDKLLSVHRTFNFLDTRCLSISEKRAISNLAALFYNKFPYAYLKLRPGMDYGDDSSAQLKRYIALEAEEGTLQFPNIECLTMADDPVLDVCGTIRCFTVVLGETDE